MKKLVILFILGITSVFFIYELAVLKKVNKNITLENDDNAIDIVEIDDEIITVEPLKECTYDNLVSTDKISYLTYDDGPTKYTSELLDYFEEENIRATFFLVGANIIGNEDIVKRMHNEGHLVLSHTYNHGYDYIYSSLDNYVSDLNRVKSLIDDTIGCISKDIVRLPGGSSNTIHSVYNETIMLDIFDYFSTNGISYLDWNIDVDSIYKGIDYEYLDDHVINTLFKRKVLLDHDTYYDVLTSTKYIVENLRSKGYSFSLPVDDLDFNVINHI